MNNHLIIFIKTPRLGAVKTRLARDIGEKAALDFYRGNVTGVVRRLSADRRWTCRLCVTPDGDAGTLGLWPPGIERFPQGAGDLGERMDRALRRPPPGPAVLIGGDVPGIKADHIAAAFAALETHDFVFGPAADGGFWLVGMKRAATPPYIFENVRWSTSDTLSDTLNNLPAGISYALVETLHDVDDVKDYQRWRRSEIKR